MYGLLARGSFTVDLLFTHSIAFGQNRSDTLYSITPSVLQMEVEYLRPLSEGNLGALLTEKKAILPN